jgi:hypothetical protein
MLLEAAVVLCLINATDTAAHGLVRDGRFKTTSARLSGTSLTYREPVAQTPFPTVAARQTGCAEIDAVTLAKPQMVIWSGQPAAAGDLPADHHGDALCRPTATPLPGQRLTFVYRKSLFGRLTCKETR